MPSGVRDTVASLLIGLSVTSMLVVVAVTLILPFYYLTSHWYLILPILTWVVYDRKTGQNGGRRLDFVYRNFYLARLCKDYFDMKLIKTGDFDPEKNYILGYHPHGCTVGLFTNFLSPCTGFRELFPGFTSYLAVLTPIVMFPVLRELALALGCVDCGADSFHSMLHGRKGVALAISVGGSVELYDMRPGTIRLTLRRRKGFARMALKYGAGLVPVLAFGDNDAYGQLLPNAPGSLIRRLQDCIYRSTGCCLLMQPWGRYGLLPHRTSIHCVVGRPIEVEKEESPSAERVDQLHARYMTELENLFHEYKHKFPGGDKVVFQIQ